MGGLAGANEILAIQGRLFQNFSFQFGFDGIVVALAGINTPMELYSVKFFFVYFEVE